MRNLEIVKNIPETETKPQLSRRDKLRNDFVMVGRVGLVGVAAVGMFGGGYRHFERADVQEDIDNIPAYVRPSGRGDLVHDLQRATQELCGLVVTGEGSPMHETANPQKADNIIFDVMSQTPPVSEIHDPLTQVRQELNDDIQRNTNSQCEEGTYVDERQLILSSMQGVADLSDSPAVQQQEQELGQLQDKKSVKIRQAISGSLASAGAFGGLLLLTLKGKPSKKK